ncbi:MAG: hypothetical protein DRM99_03660 [Thermoplasmata archaeon]|nr:MAG: hypothetical protein DRM99_03660 [Thermoplasmata archaeon]
MLKLTQPVGSYIDPGEMPVVPSSSDAVNKLVQPLPEAPPRIFSRGITLIYGTGGAGKTSLCLDACFNVIDKYKILYIDTERGVDLWRIRQIMKARKLKYPIKTTEDGYIVNKLKIIREPTLGGLLKLMKIVQDKKPDVLIIDNIASHYLVLICQDTKISSYGKPSKEMIVLTNTLMVFTNKWNMAVGVTTQPVSDVKKAEILELEKGLGVDYYDERDYIGGKGLEFNPKVQLRIEKRGKTERLMVLMKHRSKKPGETCKFKITDWGVGDI